MLKCVTNKRNLCWALAHSVRSSTSRSLRRIITFTFLIALVLGTALDTVSAGQHDQRSTDAQDPSITAGFLQRLPIQQTLQDFADYSLPADNYYENTADIWFTFSSYPSTVFFSITSGCGTITPTSTKPPLIPSPYKVYTTYTPCEVEDSTVIIKADPSSGSNQYASIYLEPRIDISCGEYYYMCVATYNAKTGLPAEAHVYVTVIPPEAGTVSPSSGWSEYDYYYEKYIFCSTYTAGSYSGRVRVKFRIDNPSPYDDSILIYSFDQTCISCSPPTEVTASDGTYTDKVRITWNAVSSPCNYYRVYRASSSTGTKTALGSGCQTSTTFNDTTATPGVTYYYWVKSAKDSSCSEPSGFSSCDTGWRKLSPPTGVSASDGTYTDKVCITWNGVSGATYYRVYRATSPTGIKLPLSDWQTLTNYCDYTAEPGITYYYWVKAAVGSGGSRASDYSAYDTGWRSVMRIPMDLNNDGIVNFSDFAIFAFYWMDDTCSDPDWCEGSDSDYSGRVDFVDLLDFVDYWLWCWPDLDMDDDVDFADFALFANHWMEQNCVKPSWCETADLDRSGEVDFTDLKIFTEYWLEGIWWPILGDLNGDSKVNFADFALFADNWLETDCKESNNWCEGADLDKSGSVDLYDLGKFADSWLEGF
jgi:hypothetical protein